MVAVFEISAADLTRLPASLQDSAKKVKILRILVERTITACFSPSLPAKHRASVDDILFAGGHRSNNFLQLIWEMNKPERVTYDFAPHFLRKLPVNYGRTWTKKREIRIRHPDRLIQ